MAAMSMSVGSPRRSSIPIFIFLLVALFAATILTVNFARHSSPTHDPRLSAQARQTIEDVSRKISQKLNNPNTGPTVLCAIAVYQNGVQYVRVLVVAEGATTGDMAWYGPTGWAGAFEGKDVAGFLNGVPRGVVSYDTGRPLDQCLNTFGGGIPPASQIKP